MSDRAKFVGTYRLITTEVKDAASGDWVQRPNFNRIGYITYADTGHMGVHIMARSRPPFASNPPTGEEAQAALRGYTAYFGSFTVDDTGQFVVHHRFGQINPGGTVDAKRFYDFEGERLILTADTGGWQRQRHGDKPSSVGAPAECAALGRREEVRRVLQAAVQGQIQREKRRGGVSWGRELGQSRHLQHYLHADGSYDGSPDAERGADEVCGRSADPAEALKAFRSYGGYFGRFTTYENYTPPFVMHNQQGTTRPARDVDATKRFHPVQFHATS